MMQSSSPAGAPHSTVLEENIPWFMTPFFEKMLEESSLSESDRALVRAYAKDGYVVVDVQFDGFDAAVERIRGVLQEKVIGRDRLQDGWVESADIKTLATLPSIERILTIFYRRDPIPFQTLNFVYGTQQRTHSDSLHFNSVPNGFMCGVWVALEDVDEKNGPLHVYPGSHTLPILDCHDLGLPSGREHYQEYEEAIHRYVGAVGLPKKVLNVKKGQAVIWSANVLHGGEVIRDPDRTRLSQVTHYFFDHCLYYTPLHSDPFIGKVHLRHIRDIRTGENVPNIYGGRVIRSVPEPVPEPTTTQLAKKLTKRVLKKFF
jgi:hypothetical protein